MQSQSQLQYAEPDPGKADVILARRLSSDSAALNQHGPGRFEYLVKCSGMSYLRTMWMPLGTLMNQHQP
jgi:hypothetical protein